MSQQEDDPRSVIIRARYFGYTRCPCISLNANPFDEAEVTEPVIHLCTCAREGCGKTETLTIVPNVPSINQLVKGVVPTSATKIVVTKFPRCPICHTKYCSRECQVADHKSGQHKEKCARFSKMQEYYEKNLCSKCWKAKSALVSDPYPNGKPSNKGYKPCARCFTKEMAVTNHVPQDIVSDPDIERVWIP